MTIGMGGNTSNRDQLYNCKQNKSTKFNFFICNHKTRKSSHELVIHCVCIEIRF